MNTAPHSTPSLLASAALAVAIEHAADHGTIQLFPLGTFTARDGRPSNIKGVAATSWKLTPEIAVNVIANWQARKTQTVIDYEHQTQLTEKNGQPAPAAGWIVDLMLQDGGLFARVDWTERARSHIRASEYKYISPTFRYDPQTGAVLDVVSAALTNFPALDGMLPAQAKTQGDAPMNELLALLRIMLGLPEAATEADCKAALVLLPQDTPLPALLKAQAEQLASLKEQQAATPDPAQYVPMSMLTAVNERLAAIHTELASLKQHSATASLATEIDEAIKDGRLPAMNKDWALALAKSNPTSLRQYLATAPKIAALTSLQTEGKAPEGTATTSLSTEDTYVAAQLGLKPEDMKKECK